MRLTISMRAARAAALAAIAGRVFVGLAVDQAWIHSGTWLSAPLGLLIALPWVLGLARVRGIVGSESGLLRRALSLVLLASLWVDLACVASGISRSADWLTPDSASPTAFLLPLGLAWIWCARRNGDAIGYSAMIWARLFPVLAVIIALMQWRTFRVEWLRPVLGAGPVAILNSGVRVAGWIIAGSTIIVVSESPNDDEKARPGTSLLAPIAVGTAVASLLVLMRLIALPPSLGRERWLYRLDALLTNGRSPLYLQLPLLFSWFIGLTHLLVIEGFAAAALLQRVIPGLDGTPCALIVAAVTGAMALFSPPGVALSLIEEWRCATVMIPTACAMLLDAAARKEAMRGCAR